MFLVSQLESRVESNGAGKDFTQSLGQKRPSDFLFKANIFIGPLVRAATTVLYVDAIKADNIRPFARASNSPLTTSLVSEGVFIK